MHISASIHQSRMSTQLVGKHAEQRLLVDRLRCEASADDIVAARHALHDFSLQIGVRDVRAHVDGITGIHHDHVEEIGRENAAIRRILDVKRDWEDYRLHQAEHPLLDERNVLFALEMLLEGIDRLDGMLRIGFNVGREQSV